MEPVRASANKALALYSQVPSYALESMKMHGERTLPLRERDLASELQ
jgi:hypothetical protein